MALSSSGIEELGPGVPLPAMKIGAGAKMFESALTPEYVTEAARRTGRLSPARSDHHRSGKSDAARCLPDAAQRPTGEPVGVDDHECMNTSRPRRTSVSRSARQSTRWPRTGGRGGRR